MTMAGKLLVTTMMTVKDGLPTMEKKKVKKSRMKVRTVIGR